MRKIEKGLGIPLIGYDASDKIQVEKSERIHLWESLQFGNSPPPAWLDGFQMIVMIQKEKIERDWGHTMFLLPFKYFIVED